MDVSYNYDILQGRRVYFYPKLQYPVLLIIGFLPNVQKCMLVWELRVVGWEVTYSSEFVPNTEGAYTIVIQKSRKMSPADEPVISSSFKIVELGKLLITIDNPTTKKKKFLYRFKVVPYAV